MSLTPFEIERLAEVIADKIAAKLSEQRTDALIDVHGAAALLSCSVPTIERRTRDGSIPSVKVGRLRRYRRVDLLAVNKKGGADA